MSGSKQKTDKGLRIERQAVVIIHGIGEQRPMSTLRSFVSAIGKFPGKYGKPDGDGAPAHTWSRPDKLSEGFEHRRLSIPQSSNRPKTDVYELYWAHLFEQTDSSTFMAWAKMLFLRKAKNFPPRMRPYLCVLRWVVPAIALAIGVISYLIANQPKSDPDLTLWPVLITVVAGAAISFIAQWVSGFFLGTISDAARYLDASARNVTSRNKARELGVEFLERLHAAKDADNVDADKYDRIIVVGHSLGTVIGYDILKSYWYRVYEAFDPTKEAPQDVVKEMRSAIKDTLEDKEAPDIHGWRDLQEQVWLEYRRIGNPWRVTDFVSLGSPLAHADVLLATSEQEFYDRQNEQEFPTAPPTLDPVSKEIWKDKTFNRPYDHPWSVKLLNHSAMFSVMRWTNVYFPVWGGVLGDPVGGPASPLFGPAVWDRPVRRDGQNERMSHLNYWAGQINREDPQEPMTALEDAMQLERKWYGIPQD
ncbi:MAG: hypothetical protein AAGB16_06105 [Pseudomonadota bacterium]